MRAVWVALLLAATVLAGCADDSGSGDAGDDELFEGFEEEADVSSDKGLIRGVVVDEVITPVVGAKVTLVQNGEVRETNENGAFVFGDLDPGSYFLKAEALGFESVQQSVNVEAGVANPPAVKILLPADPNGVPFFEEHLWEGYIDCGTFTGILFFAACGVLADFGLSEDEFATCIRTGGNMSFMQAELVWESTQEIGDTLYMANSYANTDCGFQGNFAPSVSGTSPVVARINQGQLDSEGIGTDAYYYPRVFTGESNTVPLVGLTLQQDFTLFVHGFHGYLPPEDWQFSDAEGVPGPE